MTDLLPLSQLLNISSKDFNDFEKNQINIVSTSLGLFSDIFLSRKINFSLAALSNYFLLWKKAISSFKQGNLVDFDALVGENSCQIRAYILVNILEKFNHNGAKLFLNEIYNSLDTLIQHLAEITLSKKEESLSVKQFLEKYNLYFFIHKTILNDVKFILDAYILTACKKSDSFLMTENINYIPLIKLGFVAKKAKMIIKGSQQSLSFLSCQYIKDESTRLNYRIYEELLQAKCDDIGRSCLPHFYSAKVILKLLLSKRRILIVKIKRYWQQAYLDSLTLFYCANKEGDAFVLINPSIEKNAYVLEGLVNYTEYPETIKSYKNRLLKFNLYDLLLANFACHPQYAGNKKNEPIPFANIRHNLQNDQQSATSTTEEKQTIENKLQQLNIEENDFNEKRALALEAGCCHESQKLLFLKHIYSDKVNNHLQLPMIV